MKGSWIVFTLLLFALPSRATVQMYYLHNDHLGTPAVVTNQAQQVVWKGQMKPFGETTVEIEAITNHRRFPGQRLDIESRLYYNYFRDYDPSTGRYIQSDPIGLRGGLNTYSYVGANPLRYSDPTGEYFGLIAIPVCILVAHHFHVGDSISTPAGNPWGPDKADLQDQVCSSIAYPLNSFERAKRECLIHDDCYAANGCGYESWAINVLGGTKSCNQCNSTIVRNLVGF